MNVWLKNSIDYANQRSYLDDLFKVYPTIPDGIRTIDNDIWKLVENNFKLKNNKELIKSLLKLDLFPIKDSYVSFIKRDYTAIDRNPNTIDRLAGRLYELGLDKIWERSTLPKETNRQIGPMFRNWILSGSLGIMPIKINDFISNNNNAILNGSDEELKYFAQQYLGYENIKGLDFIARFNNKYIVGEAKFITDFGGHQNAQFNDAMNIFEYKFSKINVVRIAILDGVLYIPNNGKLYKLINTNYSNLNIMSSLVLREFLYTL